MEGESVIMHEWSRGDLSDVTGRVSPTKVEFKSGVQPQKSSGPHDILDSFEGTGRPGDAKSLGGCDRILELTSDLLSLQRVWDAIGAKVIRTVGDSMA